MSIVKIILALVLTFGLSLLIAPWVLAQLRKKHAEQHILEIGPKWHETKAGTPTMGGIIFIIPVMLITLALAIVNLIKGDFRLCFSMIFALLCGAIGLLDDSVKIFKARNKGLTVRQKTVTLMLVIALYLGGMYLMGYIDDSLFIPFVNISIPMGVFYFLLMLPLAFFYVNAVNLTDGLDGLATGVTVPYGITSIGAKAFKGCTAITKISLSHTVTSVGAEAFSGCKNLRTVKIPSSVKSIGYGAFPDSNKLTVLCHDPKSIPHTWNLGKNIKLKKTES